MLPPVTSWIIWAVLKLFWTNSIVLWSLLQFLQSPEGEGRTRRWESQNSNSPEGVREKKALLSYTAIMPDFSFSVLLSHRLLMFLSVVQSRGCRDILPLGQHYKELPKSGPAGCLPAILQTFYTFLTNGCISLPRPCRQSTQRRGSARARQGTVTDTST